MGVPHILQRENGVATILQRDNGVATILQSDNGVATILQSDAHLYLLKKQLLQAYILYIFSSSSHNYPSQHRDKRTLGQRV